MDKKKVCGMDKKGCGMAKKPVVWLKSLWY